MASCDPRVLKKGEDIIDRWFKKGGIIDLNLGKDSSKFFKQFYESTTGINFDNAHKPITYAQSKHLENRVKRLEKGFKKKTGKIAEMFFLSDEVVKRNYQAKKTFDYFVQQHDFFQGKRDEYQQTMNTIVHLLGEKARALGLMKGGKFKDMNQAHKELQKRYNEYQRIITEEGWGKAEDYWNNNLANLSKESQFKIFELADNALRHPDLVKKEEGTYGIFSDVVEHWQKISGGAGKSGLYGDLKNGLDAYIRAMNESNKLTNNKYSRVLEGLKRIREGLKKQPNYFPTEALNIIPTIRVIQESIYDRSWKSKDYDKLSDYVENIADEMGKQLKLSRHAREKKSKDKLRRSIDVVSMMDKYIRNVTMFNFAGHTTESLLKGVRRLSLLEGDEMKEQAKFYSKYLYDTHAALLGLNINSSMGRNLVRGITSWEFMSKLGLNIRSAARNATQSLQNIVYFGVSGTYNSFKYLQGEMGRIADGEAKKYGVYFASARELTNTLGLFPEVTTANVKGVGGKEKQVMTYKYDTKAQKFTNGLEELARKSGSLMRVVENKVNRQLTFKLAFALHHRYLSNNVGVMEQEVKNAIRTGQRRLKKGETVQSIVNEAVVNKSSAFAANSVKELHYEYSPFAKPKIMRGGVASVLTQFMTYGVNFYNYQYKIAREAKDSLLAGDWRSEQSFRLYRLGMLYSFLYGVLAPLTNTDIGNLVQHDTYERLKNFTDQMSEDPTIRKRAFFGKGPLIGTVGGPFISDVITLGNVFGFYDLLSNGEMSDSNLLGYLAGYEDYASKRKSEKVFDVVRVLNTQVARSAFVSLPRMWNGASFGTLAEIESGLFKDKLQQQRKLEYMYPLLKPFGVKKPKYAVKKGRKKKPQPKRNLVLESLESLSKTIGSYT